MCGSGSGRGWTGSNVWVVSVGGSGELGGGREGRSARCQIRLRAILSRGVPGSGTRLQISYLWGKTDKMSV